MMVGTRGSTLEFLGPAFEAAVQQAVDALLPGLTTRLTNEIRQNGAEGSGDQPPTIHTWLERLASYKLEGDALNWWKAFKQARGGETYVATLSWKDFHDIFFLQYFPRLAGFVGTLRFFVRGYWSRPTVIRSHGRTEVSSTTVLLGLQVRKDTRTMPPLLHVTHVGNFIRARHVTQLLKLVSLVVRLGIWPGIRPCSPTINSIRL
ncbi:hypothetical protein Tco_1102979 [Tanacetum coccineum]